MSIPFGPYGPYGPPHHGYGPKCEKGVKTVTKKFCGVKIEKECVTETKTFTKITGYEKGDCKEVEVCKHGYGFGHHGYPVPECEKETKEVCRQVPTKEEVSKDFELCRPVPKEVCFSYNLSRILHNHHHHQECEEKEIEVPTLICGEEKKEE